MTWAHQVYSVVHQLADIVRPSFGPLGRDQLLQSPSTLLVTNSTSTILASLLASPHFLPASAPASHRAIASVVLHQLRQCTELNGDGGGAALLMLDAALHDVVGWLRERGVTDAQDSSSTGARQYVRALRPLLRGLDAVDRAWSGVAGDDGAAAVETGLMAELRTIGQPVDSDFPALLHAFEQLLHTQLGQPPHTERYTVHPTRRVARSPRSPAVDCARSRQVRRRRGGRAAAPGVGLRAPLPRARLQRR